MLLLTKKVYATYRAMKFVYQNEDSFERKRHNKFIR